MNALFQNRRWIYISYTRIYEIQCVYNYADIKRHSNCNSRENNWESDDVSKVKKQIHINITIIVFVRLQRKARKHKPSLGYEQITSRSNQKNEENVL